MSPISAGHRVALGRQRPAVPASRSALREVRSSPVGGVDRLEPVPQVVESALPVLAPPGPRPSPSGPLVANSRSCDAAAALQARVRVVVRGSAWPGPGRRAGTGSRRQLVTHPRRAGIRRCPSQPESAEQRRGAARYVARPLCFRAPRGRPGARCTAGAGLSMAEDGTRRTIWPAIISRGRPRSTVRVLAARQR